MNQLENFLVERGFTHLFHANTFDTSLSYLSLGLLASRAQLESRKLPQTSQFTDDVDQRYGVFDDVFLNFHDHHRLWRRPNSYGPVLFEINVERLLQYFRANTKIVVGVTKRAVEKWADTDSIQDRWVESVAALDARFEARDAEPEEKRRWLVDRDAIDIVVHLAQFVPLNCVDRIVVERHPEDSNAFDHFVERADSIWPNAYKRLEIIRQRTGCQTNCRCSDKTYWEKKGWKLNSGFRLEGWSEEGANNKREKDG